MQHIALKLVKLLIWEELKDNEGEFDRLQAYKLVAVLDSDGVDKVHTRNLYKDRINCIAVDFHYDKRPVYDEKYRMNMTFVQTENGLWCKRRLHILDEIVKDVDGILEAVRENRQD